VNDDSFRIWDPAEIVVVDWFGSDPEFPLDFVVQRVALAPTQPFGEPHERERERERGERGGA
jgi:hypothetical protein